MKERLNELVKTLKERNTIRKILQAKDVKAAYEEEKEALKEQLESFEHEVHAFTERDEYPISNVSEVICTENVVEVCFILLMTGVNDDDLTEDWVDIETILNQVQGDLQEIAQKFSEFLYEESQLFSNWTEEKLLKKLIL